MISEHVQHIIKLLYQNKINLYIREEVPTRFQNLKKYKYLKIVRSINQPINTENACSDVQRNIIKNVQKTKKSWHKGVEGNILKFNCGFENHMNYTNFVSLLKLHFKRNVVVTITRVETSY